MTLWNIIRDFFVRYVFGGMDSTYETYDNFIGTFWDFDNEYNATLGTANATIQIEGLGDAGSFGLIPNLTFGDWLSTTATIITLVALFIGITLLIIKLFRFVSNLFLLR